MKPDQTGAPLELHLPSGRRAQLVPGSRPPIYTIDGQETAIDVTIPDDLAALGWCWFGSTLYQPYPGRDDGPGIGIATCTFPPPPIESVRGSCFDAAREIERVRAEHAALRVARPAKKVKVRKQTIVIPDVPIEVVPEPELAFEQAALAMEF